LNGTPSLWQLSWLVITTFAGVLVGWWTAPDPQVEIKKKPSGCHVPLGPDSRYGNATQKKRET
jgi:hypothetical protein